MPTYKLKCLNNSCGCQVSVPIPSKAMNFSFTCNKCKVAQIWMYKGIGSTGEPVFVPYGIKKVDKPAGVDVGKAKLLQGSFSQGEAFAVTCPACQNATLAGTPAQAGPNQIQCPQCGTLFSYTAQPKTVIVQPKPGAPCMGRLVKLSSSYFGSNQAFQLPVGIVVIGSRDEQSPSDLMFKDRFMSRRTASIETKALPSGGYEFIFTLKRTTNPVYFNNQQIMPVYKRPLRFGDCFTLGETKFRFESIDGRY